MCGIFGFVDWRRRLPADSHARLREMGRRLHHRGPDGVGFFESARCALGATRLAIVDIEHGDQPAANEDGRIRVVLNGEIYNHDELRERLSARGHRFRGRGDTEVIAHLYEAEGERFVDSLRGMFAIAILDQRRQKLLLVRDRLGEKPLYFAKVGTRLAFASEPKALLVDRKVDRALAPAALDHYFAYMATPLRESIWRGIAKLPPAHRLSCDASGVTVERYWSLDANPAPLEGSEAQLLDETRARLDEAIMLRGRADVAVGAFLSGGIDTGLVAAVLSRQTRRPLRTWALGFPSGFYDESADAEHLARHLGARHETVRMPAVTADDLITIAAHFDEPFADTSALPTYFVSRTARRRAKVVLGGDGGDEVFAGYGHHRLASRGPAVDGHDDLLRFHPPMFGPEERALLYEDDWFAEQQRSGDARSAYAYEAGALPTDAVNRELWLDLFHFLPNDMLTKVDRMSMAHGLEVRSPFLDHELVEFAWRLPPAMKLKNGALKYVLKRLLRGVVPPATLRKPKHGFALEPGLLARPPLASLVDDLLSPARLRRLGGVRTEIVQLVRRGYADAIERRLPAPQVHSHELRVWSLVSFELWRESAH